MASPDLSIVILCYQAGAWVRDLVEDVQSGFAETNLNIELILVANYWPGTEDVTPAVVKELAETYPGCTAVAQPKKGMMGWDMRSGLARATGQVIAVIDGDNQYPPAALLEVYSTLIEGRYDLAKTIRTTREDGGYRWLISKGYNLVFTLLFPGGHFGDVNAKPKFMTRSAYQQMDLQADDWFIDAEIMIQARRYGFSIGEVPVRFRKNTQRPSFVKPAAIFEFIKNLVVYRIKEFRVTGARFNNHKEKA